MLPEDIQLHISSKQVQFKTEKGTNTKLPGWSWKEIKSWEVDPGTGEDCDLLSIEVNGFSSYGLHIRHF